MNARGRRSAAPTPSERAALWAVCEPGARTDTAAAALGLSTTALNERLRSLYRRLGVNNAAQARHVVARLDAENPYLHGSVGAEHENGHRL